MEPELIKKLREIKINEVGKIGKIEVNSSDAGAIIAVYDNLDEKCRKIYVKMNINKMIQTAWRMILIVGLPDPDLP